MQKVSRFSVEKFSSHSAEKFRRGTRLCFRKIRVSKNFMPKRGISRFSKENLFSTVPKNLVGESFFVSQNLWYPKKLWIRGGGGEYHDFLSILCLTVPKNIVGEPLSVSLISGIESFYVSESYATSLCRNFFVSQCRKIS